MLCWPRSVFGLLRQMRVQKASTPEAWLKAAMIATRAADEDELSRAHAGYDPNDLDALPCRQSLLLDRVEFGEAV